MKSQQNAILLADRTIFFSILLKYWQLSKYAVMLSEFGFPKKEKESSLSFRWSQGFFGAMVNSTFENLNLFFHQTNKIIVN